MLAAVRGIVQGNTVIIEDEDIREYDGTEVIVTLLNYPQKKVRKAPVDWDSFWVTSQMRCFFFCENYILKIAYTYSFYL